MADYMTEELKEWPIERKKLSELNPASYNPRIISSNAKAGLNKSIEVFGLQQPIIWNKKTGNIVGGHQRYKVLLDQGVTETDVVIVELSDNEEIALNITLNNPLIEGEFTEFVMDQLSEVSDSLDANFNNLKLSDLQEELNERFNKDKEVTVPVHKIENKAQKKKNKEVIPDEKILIECPRCSSVYRKSDGKVLFENKN